MEKPKIRFKGYQEDWEQRKLGEVFKEYSEKNHTELPALTIIQGGGTVKREESDRNLMYDESNLSNYKMVRKDDFIVHLRSFEGGLEKSLLDGIISPAYHTFHSDVADSRFYYPYFRSHEFIKHKLVPHVYGIRDGRSIDIAGMKTIEIPYTSIEEQRKIGDYLESLDHLITLHQRKCEEMKTLKKYMLQKMFPQNGQSVPQIRFSGFTEDWEQRKLSELATMHARIGWQNLRTSEFLDAGDYMLITGTDFEEGKVNYSTCHYVEKERYDQDKNIQIKNGNILITKDGTLGKVAYVEGLSLPATLNAGVFNVEVKDENETDSKYLFQFLKAPFLMDYVSKKATGGTIKHLNQNILVDFPIATPSRAEQVRIGEYFSTLDDLITLHQQKCDELRNIKKFMLQNMFI
ncbi:restriction endonuclease subunit S [Dorea formicigenerans]|uniref:Restriction endonuclease subunit S n=1 Tax=Dorea formicigenerans TaxID=39486 RepID=A0A848CG19_9FIRM|nr:restriction endonuclease subunit S [Dorea formicigenerans]NME56059.1 restriction endonuclease subunit S [Dorea formicigenerans]